MTSLDGSTVTYDEDINIDSIPSVLNLCPRRYSVVTDSIPATITLVRYQELPRCKDVVTSSKCIYLES